MGLGWPFKAFEKIFVHRVLVSKIWENVKYTEEFFLNEVSLTLNPKIYLGASSTVKVSVKAVPSSEPMMLRSGVQGL